MNLTEFEIPIERVFHFSLETYHKLGSQGLIPRNTELIEGVVVYKMTVSPIHVRIVLKIRDLLTKNLESNYLVRQESPISVEDSEPEPDISVVKGTYDDFMEEHPKTAEFVIEVAYSSIEDDLRKAKIYAKAKVIEYWIFDLLNKKILVFKDSNGFDYTRKLEINSHEEILLPIQTIQPVYIKLDNFI